MDIFLVAVIILLAVFTQSVSGYGSALVAMALLPGILDVRLAAPLVALVALTLEATLLVRYRSALNVRAVLPLVAASAFGVPLGVWTLKGVDSQLFLGVLGVLIAGYALYALWQVRLPGLAHPAWAYIAGFLAGILGGAYNTSGPPVVVYGSCKGWSPQEFKSNLQGFFLVSDLLVVLTHALNHNLTWPVWRHYLWALPALILGLVAGTSLDRYINPQVFRKIMLVFLVVMGVRLIL